ncbi:NUDIX domain-containing protein [Streptomyces sp. NPDC007901]|uniref:NUDIX domain-containing protein n=1 Tax=Streptomyces sp. NPDC007901 TaxID=3364785 RepID=UPI0036E0EBEB
MASNSSLAPDSGSSGSRPLEGGLGQQDPQVVAVRELEEETGLVVGESRLLGVFDPLPATTGCTDPSLPGHGC